MAQRSDQLMPLLHILAKSSCILAGFYSREFVEILQKTASAKTPFQRWLFPNALTSIALHSMTRSDEIAKAVADTLTHTERVFSEESRGAHIPLE